MYVPFPATSRSCSKRKGLLEGRWALALTQQHGENTSETRRRDKRPMSQALRSKAKDATLLDGQVMWHSLMAEGTDWHVEAEEGGGGARGGRDKDRWMKRAASVIVMTKYSILQRFEYLVFSPPPKKR